MTVRYELAVKTGEYQKDGEKKNRYQNIGVIMDKGDGPFMLLHRSFNPAGVGEGESVLISLFKPKGRTEKSAPTQQAPLDDEIPF